MRNLQRELICQFVGSVGKDINHSPLEPPWLYIPSPACFGAKLPARHVCFSKYILGRRHIPVTLLTSRLPFLANHLVRMWDSVLPQSAASRWSHRWYNRCYWVDSFIHSTSLRHERIHLYHKWLRWEMNAACLPLNYTGLYQRGCRGRARSLKPETDRQHVFLLLIVKDLIKRRHRGFRQP